MTPGTTKHEGNSIPFPCGKCPACKARRVSSWAFRIEQEYTQAESAQFITLTYDTRYVPIVSNGQMALRKKDLQDFFKRLRKSMEKYPLGRPIKYYAVGEYGGRTKRPHYHIILLNARIEKIQPAWNLGQVHYGQVSSASIAYTLKYISKPSKLKIQPGDPRQKEFSLMSKGIGLDYLTNTIRAWHEADILNRMYCTTHDGKKIPMPRYYKDKVFTESDLEQIANYQRQLVEKTTLMEMIELGDEYFYQKSQEHLGAFAKQDYQTQTDNL